MTPDSDDRNVRRLVELADSFYEGDALGALEDYLRIPCVSPNFDAAWEATGHLERAARQLADWAASRPVADLSVEVVKLPGLSPVIIAEAPASPGSARPAGSAGEAGESPTLLYGHLDKQPPLGTWREGLHPFSPVREDDRLYGRGAADDGYSIFAAVGAIEVAERSGIGHGRCVVLIEASEESGSSHLEPYLERLADRLGPAGPSLVVCLDSGCRTYDRLWTTTSLRGLVSATIRVDVLTRAVHSGAAGGVVPSSFRILRELLSRVEDEATGEILLPGLGGDIPAARRREAEELVETLGESAIESFPTVPGLRLGGKDLVERVLARTWRPSLAFVGLDGVPPIADAGNVVRPFTTAKIALRVAPDCDAEALAAQLAAVLSDEPPDGAAVAVEANGSRGFDAPAVAPWLADAVASASEACFGKAARSMGEGGTIPFVAQLAHRFPAAQFLVTGVLGPDSNAHGPDEMLHLPTAKRLTASVAHVLSQVP